MARSKYINTFNTTADYENYIESAYPEFPNVGYDKQAGKVKITRTSPNDHVIYGELADATQNIQVMINRQTPSIVAHNDSLNNTFYLDQADISSFNTITTLYTFINSGNVTNIKKISLNTSSCTSFEYMFNGCSSMISVDLSSLNTSQVTNMGYMFTLCSSLTSLDLSNFNTSKVTNMGYMFDFCNSLTSLDLSNCDFSNVTNRYNMFRACNSLTDVYITVEATLMKLTNNLASYNGEHIPSSATIHYDNGSEVIDYKWQNNAWTPQS